MHQLHSDEGASRAPLELDFGCRFHYLKVRWQCDDQEKPNKSAQYYDMCPCPKYWLKFIFNRYTSMNIPFCATINDINKHKYSR